MICSRRLSCSMSNGEGMIDSLLKFKIKFINRAQGKRGYECGRESTGPILGVQGFRFSFGGGG